MYSYRVSESHGLELELLAGRNLRALRNARQWSLLEVAERMRAFGYTWHQTVVAKIETGKRPLRLAEAIDLASLYGATLTDLIGAMGPGFTLTAGELDPQIELARKRVKEAADRYQAAKDAATVATHASFRAQHEQDQAAERRRYAEMELSTLEARRGML
jgi:transcriptional regulator with XRE-family HTH domain